MPSSARMLASCSSTRIVIQLLICHLRTRTALQISQPALSDEKATVLCVEQDKNGLLASLLAWLGPLSLHFVWMTGHLVT